MCSGMFTGSASRVRGRTRHAATTRTAAMVCVGQATEPRADPLLDDALADNRSQRTPKTRGWRPTADAIHEMHGKGAESRADRFPPTLTCSWALCYKYNCAKN